MPFFIDSSDNGLVPDIWKNTGLNDLLKISDSVIAIELQDNLSIY